LPPTLCEFDLAGKIIQHESPFGLGIRDAENVFARCDRFRAEHEGMWSPHLDKGLPLAGCRKSCAMPQPTKDRLAGVS
jgi:hypothetical protein